MVPSNRDLLQPILWVTLFAIAFAWVEASVVVYLRDLYYPEGFAFPLKIFEPSRLGVELVREFATLIMLGAVGILAGRTRWQRFAHFAIAFGVWDIFFYLWLKVAIDWPASILDWDILFLLPVPWIGPVLAPVLVSVMLIVGGSLILFIERTHPFSPPRIAWLLATLGSLVILATFIQDVDAGIHGALPKPFMYEMFLLGLSLYPTSMYLSWRAHRSTQSPRE